MLTAWATLPLSALLLFFAVAALAFAMSIGGLAAATLGRAIIKRDRILGALIGLLVWGGFATLFGYHALQLGVYVINGVIGRFG